MPDPEPPSIDDFRDESGSVNWLAWREAVRAWADRVVEDESGPVGG